MTEEGMEQHAIHGTMTANDLHAGRVLNVADFPGKWKEAKRMATEPIPEAPSFTGVNWAKARQLFLELGGEFVGQKQGTQSV
jgi:hypothetical protein